MSSRRLLLLLLLFVPAVAFAAKPIETLTDEEQATFREAIGVPSASEVPELRGIDRLFDYRAAVNNSGAYRRPNILFFGDSMIGTALATLRQQVESYGEISGWGLLPGALGGGATIESDACVKWLNGETFLLNASGEYVDFLYNGANALEGDLLKVYHLQQSGGGNFKIRSSVNGAAFADEAGYTSIATAGATAGVVTTVTKTTYAATYKLRVEWVSGTVNIIGGGIRDSKRFGPVVSFVTNGSTGINNIDNASTTASAIINPILADIGPNLVILSHLDGAAMVTANQEDLQDNIEAGIVSTGGPAPSWVVVGPPIGYDNTQDAHRVAQQAAQRTLADSRTDAFFDNRTWALPVSTVVSRGLITDTTHYAAIAQTQWVPALFRDLGIFAHTMYEKNSVPSIDIQYGGSFRGSVSGTPTYTQTETMHMGNLRLQPPAGTTGSGGLLLMDTAGPASNNDWAQLYFTNNIFSVNLSGGGHGINATNNIGQFEFSPFDTAGNSRLGTTTARWGRVFAGGYSAGIASKTATYAALETDYTILGDATSGAFDVDLPAAASHSGRIYVVVKIDASGNAVSIDPNASELINGSSTSLALAAQWDRAHIQSNGTSWFRID